MATLLDRILTREGTKWTAEDLERLAQQAERECASLRRLLTEADGKLSTLDQAQGSLAALTLRVRELERVQDAIRNLQERLDHADGVSESMTTEYRRLSGVAESLKAQLAKLEEREQTVAAELGRAAGMVSGIQDALSGLSAAKTLARQGEEQLHKLNALSEHVGRRSRPSARPSRPSSGPSSSRTRSTTSFRRSRRRSRNSTTTPSFSRRRRSGRRDSRPGTASSAPCCGRPRVVRPRSSGRAPSSGATSRVRSPGSASTSTDRSCCAKRSRSPTPGSSSSEPTSAGMRRRCETSSCGARRSPRRAARPIRCSRW